MARRQSPASESLRLLLATDRPAVHEFLVGVAAVADRMPADVGSLEAHADELEAADVAVVDVGGDPARAILLCEGLASRRPELPLAAVLCCPHALSPRDLRRLVASGVDSMLDLQTSRDEAAQALQRIAHGDTVLSMHLRNGERALLREMLLGRDIRDETKLALLELVARGLTDSEVARTLHLSPHTVKHQIDHLRVQLGVRNRIELAAWAGRQGFYVHARPARA